MIIWLASFPRSGNTFLRMLLKQSLGLETYSLHEGDDADFGGETGLSEIVGHIDGNIGLDIVERARTSPDLHIIKTHQGPLTDDPAIFIVRDGRAATVSYFHYQQDRGFSGATMESVIEGNSFCGSWTSHFEAWQPETRANTLLLRFEELLADPTAAIGQISAFTGRPKVGDFALSFDQLKKISPKFFRSGSNSKNNAEMDPYLPVFVSRHGRLMRRLGYMTDAECLENLEAFASIAIESKIRFDAERAALEWHQHTIGMLDALTKGSSEQNQHIFHLLEIIISHIAESEKNNYMRFEAIKSLLASKRIWRL